MYMAILENTPHASSTGRLLADRASRAVGESFPTTAIELPLIRQHVGILHPVLARPARRQSHHKHARLVSIGAKNTQQADHRRLESGATAA
jgi:hypothetical protein